MASVLAFAAGCGGAPSPEPATAGDAPPLPSTALDPPTFTPQPTGETVAVGSSAPAALSTTGSHERARLLAVEVLLALRDGDEATLIRLLDERVSQVQPRLGAPLRTRADLIRGALENPRRAGLGPSIPLEELVDVDSFEVRPLSEQGPTELLPEGLSESDLLVTVRLRPRGRSYLRFLVPGWNLRGTILVRPDREARVVGL